jgi:hypothetical protein
MPHRPVNYLSSQETFPDLSPPSSPVQPPRPEQPVPVAERVPIIEEPVIEEIQDPRIRNAADIFDRISLELTLRILVSLREFSSNRPRGLCTAQEVAGIFEAEFRLEINRDTPLSLGLRAH